MKRFILTLVISAVSLLITAHFIEGFEVSGIEAAAIAAIALGFVNATIRPILSFLTLPIRFVTLGTFSLVINALMVWIVSLGIDGFTILGFLPCFLGSVILTFVSSLLNVVFNPKKKR